MKSNKKADDTNATCLVHVFRLVSPHAMRRMHDVYDLKALCHQNLHFSAIVGLTKKFLSLPSAGV